jgi:hypothetical protein
VRLGYDVPFAATGEVGWEEGSFRYIHLGFVEPERNPWRREQKRTGQRLPRGWLGARIDCTDENGATRVLPGWIEDEFPEGLDVSDGDAYFWVRLGPGEAEVRRCRVALLNAEGAPIRAPFWVDLHSNGYHFWPWRWIAAGGMFVAAVLTGWALRRRARRRISARQPTG